MAFTDEQNEQIRNDLIREARRCGITIGMRKTSVEQLTEAVGISKGSFYKFFESKELLFFAVLEDIHTECFAAAQKSLQENTALLPADKDPMGAAIADYFKRHKADRLRVFSSQFDEDEIPVEELFRTEKQMPLLERTALQMATGKILDVGAGSGCHSLTLQEAGKEVHAIDISPLSVEVMKQRGVRSVSQTNLFNEQFADEYDTILMLMNGSGIIGKLENLPDFFRKMKLLLRPGGCVLMDSSNLSYLFEEEDGSIVINLAGDYYGEVDFQMQYKNVKGDSFDWLYIDFQTLSIYAAENGFKAELVKEGTHYDYLAKLSRQA